jgi:hypothetical protein
MKKLFLAWQDPKDRSWLPVGCLTVENDNYRFVYTQGAKRSGNFQPFARMKQLDTIYESKELFPLFANRLLSKSRSEYKNFLKWLDLNENEDDPLSILALTEGIRSTDTLKVFPCPEKQPDGTYHIHFFAHGIRYLPEDAIKLINNLQAGTRLYLMFDIQNTHDPSAIALRTENPIFIVGYCPRYITKDIYKILKEQNSYEVKVLVERVNQDAPIQLRLLCNITGLWPDDFNPCSTELYEPIEP